MNPPQHPEPEPVPGENEPHIPLPKEIPKPSIYPIVAALGITFLAWGVVTSWIVSAAGFGLTALGFGGWVAELRRDIS